MLFSLTNPEVAIMMMGIFLFAVLLGFPIAFTLMAMGLGFGYYAYFDPTKMEHLFDNRIFQLFCAKYLYGNGQQCLNRRTTFSIYGLFS